jgi:electron transfer flavoprotein alpha subunit
MKDWEITLEVVITDSKNERHKFKKTQKIQTLDSYHTPELERTLTEGICKLIVDLIKKKQKGIFMVGKDGYVREILARSAEDVRVKLIGVTDYKGDELKRLSENLRKMFL